MTVTSHHISLQILSYANGSPMSFSPTSFPLFTSPVATPRNTPRSTPIPKWSVPLISLDESVDYQMMAGKRYCIDTSGLGSSNYKSHLFDEANLCTSDPALICQVKLSLDIVYLLLVSSHDSQCCPLPGGRGMEFQSYFAKSLVKSESFPKTELDVQNMYFIC